MSDYENKRQSFGTMEEIDPAFASLYLEFSKEYAPDIVETIKEIGIGNKEFLNPRILTIDRVTRSRSIALHTGRIATLAVLKRHDSKISSYMQPLSKGRFIQASIYLGKTNETLSLNAGEYALLNLRNNSSMRVMSESYERFTEELQNIRHTLILSK